MSIATAAPQHLVQGAPVAPSTAAEPPIASITVDVHVGSFPPFEETVLFEEPVTAPPKAGFTTFAEPTVVDATIARDNEAWGDLLKYQVACCGLRMGLAQAKRVLIVMSLLIVALCVLLVAGATAVETEVPLTGTVTQNLGMAPVAAACDPDPCMNDAVCVLDDTSRYGFVCECAEGFVGFACGIDTHSCRSAPCLHNSTCVDGTDGFRCECSMGFAGDLCEIDILDSQVSACTELACLNGGQCQSEGISGSVFCWCAHGFSGRRCETTEQLLPTPTEGGLNVDIGFGNGVDITSPFGPDGSLRLKFAPLFSRVDGDEPMVNELGVRESVSTTHFYSTYSDFLRSVVSSLQVQTFQEGMLSADVWAADIRQHTFTSATEGIVFGRSKRQIVVEEKTYPACTTRFAEFGECLRLHPTFLTAVEELPLSIVGQDNQRAYFSFLVTYGTHYLAKEFFGGSLSAEYFVTLGNSTTSELETLTNRVFDEIVAGNMADFTSRGFDEMHAHITSIQRAEFEVIGGRRLVNGGRMVDANFSEWATLVQNFTELVGAELESIAMLAPTTDKQVLISQALDAFLVQCIQPGSPPGSPVCENRGECRTMSGTCLCDSGFYGESCEQRSCPSIHSSVECSGHGSCDGMAGVCTCAVNASTLVPAWSGDACDHDVDECSHTGNLCAQHHRLCENTLGSYFCPMECEGGYEMDANGLCADVDECSQQGNPCAEESADATCHNIDGSFQCIVCPDGHTAHEVTGDCVDVNECFEPDNLCSVNLRECINERGAFSCGGCISGYAMDANQLCVDVDECTGLNSSALVALCGANRECVNLVGGYTCDCAPSYEEEPDGSCVFHAAQCPPYTPDHAGPDSIPCEGQTGDGCVVECANGYVSTGPARCTAEGQWADGRCVFECPTVQLHGDCSASTNQNYIVQEQLMNGKPYYISADGEVRIYYDGEMWLLDDDLDGHAIHAHLRSNNIEPTGRQMWVVWCGAYYGWTEMVLDIECSGICSDTCIAAADGVCDDGGHEALSESLCEFGTDCDDCGTRVEIDTNSCVETYDWEGNTCYTYHSIGYSCTDLVYAYGRDCACTCPELYLQGADNMPVADVYECPCPEQCQWQVTSFDSSGAEVCECHDC